jgi:hypothetical protein
MATGLDRCRRHFMVLSLETCGRLTAASDDDGHDAGLAESRADR